MCQQRTHAPQQTTCTARMFYSITSSAMASSDGGTVRPSMMGRSAVDDQRELRRLFDRDVGGLGALDDAAGIGADLAIGIRHACTIAHQPAGFGEIAHPICRGQRVARRQVDQLDAPFGEKGVEADEQRVGPLARKSRETPSIPGLVLASSPGFAIPMARAADCTSLNVVSMAIFAGLTSTATRAAPGTSSRRSSNRFAVNSPE